MFLNLGEVAVYRRCPMHPSNELASCHSSYMLLGFPLKGLHGPFYCYVGSLIGLVSPYFVWLPSSALCGCCWLLLIGVWSWGSWMQNLMGNHKGLCRTNGLMLARWWVKPGLGVSVGLLAGRASFWTLERLCRARGSQSLFQIIDGREFVPNSSVESRVPWS